MARTAMVRWTAWIAGVLVLGLLAAWIWWRESHTAARWRFEDAMEAYCGGLLAYEKSSLFEGMSPRMELPHDYDLGPDAHYCLLGGFTGTEVTVARLGPDQYQFRDVGRRLLPPFRGSLLPVPLTGGWRGAADGKSVGVLLSCRGKEDFVSVTVGSYRRQNGSDEEEVRQKQMNGWLDADLYWARFATATAVKAAARWDCKAEEGEVLRTLPPVTGPEETIGANGTCAGLPFTRDKRLDTIHETVASGSALYERCEVEASHYFDDRYTFSARFGPSAPRKRDQDMSHDIRENAGADGNALWASARCPGDTERALFTGYVPPEAATVWLPGEKGKETFGLPAFREFAERSAKRHGCTDLRLPTVKRGAVDGRRQ
ncbi:hypothetical protein [Streptomyces sp. NPDC000410]|uniref:hypothetical protein n=1 Tax=Streptomyces sp. NPDC000410 TaxID=3154254 RepID=UPI0033168EDC